MLFAPKTKTKRPPNNLPFPSPNLVQPSRSTQVTMSRQSRFRRFLSSATFAASLLLANATVFAQEGAEAAAEGGAAAPHQETLIQTIISGGPLLIMIWVAILVTS